MQRNENQRKRRHQGALTVVPLMIAIPEMPAPTKSPYSHCKAVIAEYSKVQIRIYGNDVTELLKLDPCRIKKRSVSFPRAPTSQRMKEILIF